MTALAPPAEQAGIVALLDDAMALYADFPEITGRLRLVREGIGEPLRVAVVGRVKAGKSTLLNALVGQRVAPTDAGECTRVVTWYRDAATPRVVRHDADGGRVELPVRRHEGGLHLELGGAAPEDVQRIVVDWPSSALTALTLVDTPGLESPSAGTSARTRRLVQPDVGAGDTPPDVLLYLTRQVQPDDLATLEGFATATGRLPHTTTLVVLSRADEGGSGGVGALAAAEDLARRTAAEPAVRASGLTVVPVSGLLGLAGRTLRQRDFAALRTLADADRPAVDALLLSADRFVRDGVGVDLTPSVRLELLDRLGLVGIRLCLTLLRGGLDGSDALAEELIRRSGLARLQRLVAARFAARTGTLRLDAALRAVESVLRATPVPGDERVWAALERARLSSHSLVELDLLGRLRSADGPLPGFRAEAERLLGADGTAPAERLGLGPDASPDEQTSATEEALRTWRARCADPVAERSSVDACRVLVRTLEGIRSRLGTG